MLLNFFNCSSNSLKETLFLNIDKIITVLIKNAYRPDNKQSYNIISLSFYTLNMIFYNSEKPMLCKKYFGCLVNELTKTFNMIGEHKTFL